MPPPIQLPVRSGLPAAVRGVASFDSSFTCRSLAVRAGASAALPGVIALRTLAGTGTTTYTLPVSVCSVVRSRTVWPLRFSVILPVYCASIGFSGLFQSL